MLSVSLDHEVPPGSYKVRVYDRVVRVEGEVDLEVPSSGFVMRSAKKVREFPSLINEVWEEKVEVTGRGIHEECDTKVVTKGNSTLTTNPEFVEFIYRKEREFKQAELHSWIILRELLKGINKCVLYDSETKVREDMEDLRSAMRRITDKVYLEIPIDNLSGKMEKITVNLVSSMTPPINVMLKMFGRTMDINYSHTMIIPGSFKGVVGVSDERDHVFFAKIIPSNYELSTRNKRKKVTLSSPEDLVLTQGDVILKLKKEITEDYLKLNAKIALTNLIKAAAFRFRPVIFSDSRSSSSARIWLHSTFEITSKSELKYFLERARSMDPEELMSVVNGMEGEATFDFLNTHTHFAHLVRGEVFMVPKQKWERKEQIDFIIPIQQNNFQEIFSPPLQFDHLRQEHVVGVIHLKRGGELRLVHRGSYRHKTLRISADAEVWQPFEAYLEDYL
ncbi:hypothetical protein [Sulfuracidifex tepidarius]|uniref:Uncharacterized protein n=1 Tax=Sulfuracidifex tepidarius TaxID=1294262 RepID=A0A510E0R2_9CREN|nr:hypothetical protein [Sulfuracidifex tepidarius]BBG26076.1 hypothetical protein IC007_0581 [Sulfuracidifex tepidarius]